MTDTVTLDVPGVTTSYAGSAYVATTLVAAREIDTRLRILGWQRVDAEEIGDMDNPEGVMFTYRGVGKQKRMLIFVAADSDEAPRHYTLIPAGGTPDLDPELAFSSPDKVYRATRGKSGKIVPTIWWE